MSAGRRLLVVSRWDVRHPSAGGAERYLHEIARRWVADGAEVTWVATRSPAAAAREVVDGIEVLRSGRSWGVFPHTALRLLRRGAHYDAVIDGTSRMCFAVSVITGRRVPVVQVVHGVPRLAPPRRFSPTSAVDRFLAGPLARWTRGDRAIAVPSVSSRHELRRHLGFRGPIFVVPPATTPERGRSERTGRPTIVVVAPLVPEQRLDLLLTALAPVVTRVPGLRVEFLGEGPDLHRLRGLAADVGVAASVTLHGRQPDEVRRAWLRRAWLTVSTATADACGCTVIESAAHGVPHVCLAAPGARDFVRDGVTGRVVEDADRLGDTVENALTDLTDPVLAERTAEVCRAWADRFDWDRAARLLADVVTHQIGVVRSKRAGTAQRRYARSDIATLVRFPEGATPVRAELLRATDEVSVADGEVGVLLNGCDEFDALGVLDRLGVPDARISLASRDDLLVGPRALPASLTGETTPPTRPTGSFTRTSRG
ncbi:glycosyltransferase family 4 protein [Umezawaea sp. NPDC059074]|uniref:glycosyltransferase family 4 protein n=1 Tax=Umezawaea sp. NPDC059074 TaxID=3346716 RepID=UPI003681DBBF